MNDNSDKIVSTLRQIIRAVDLHSKSLVKKYGLTGPQILVLKELANNPEQTIGNVAKTISLSQATVTSILDRLETQGMVTRIRSKVDKRKVTIELSPTALSVLESDPSLLQEDFVEQFEELEQWEKLQLLSSLQRIASMMSADKLAVQAVLVSGPVNASQNDVTNYLNED